MSCLDGVRNRGKRLKGVLFATAVLLLTGGVQAAETRQIQDAVGRTVSIPEKVERVICSGPGCLRLLTYIGGQDRIVAVDSLELGNAPVDARPYAIANPQFKKYPMFGELRGHDNPELIASLDPSPR